MSLNWLVFLFIYLYCYLFNSNLDGIQDPSDLECPNRLYSPNSYQAEWIAPTLCERNNS